MSLQSPAADSHAPDDDLHFRLWCEYEKIAMHFNDLMLRFRVQVLGGMVTLSTLAAYNPVEKVRLPKGAHACSDERWDWLRVFEISALVDDHDLSPAQRSMLVVAIYAGLRAGELCALRWDDLDLDRRVLYVRRSRTGPRKNGRAYEVPLLGPALEALQAWKLEYERNSRHSP